MNVYFDSCCCYNRPYDATRSQDDRVDREAVAVLAVMEACRRNGCIVFGSKTLEYEISRIKARDVRKFEDVHKLYMDTVTSHVRNGEDVIDERVEILCAQLGVKGLDVKHLSNAVKSEVDYLFTTDDDFEKACLGMYLRIRVINPLKFAEADMNKALSGSSMLEVREPGFEYGNKRMGVEEYCAFLDSIRNNPNRHRSGDYTAEKQARNRRLRARMAVA